MYVSKKTRKSLKKCKQAFKRKKKLARNAQTRLEKIVINKYVCKKNKRQEHLPKVTNTFHERHKKRQISFKKDN